MILTRAFVALLFLLMSSALFAQVSEGVKWAKDGKTYYQVNEDQIEQVDPVTGKATVILSAKELTPTGATRPLKIEDFSLTFDGRKILIFTNAKKVWRYATRGDYWLIEVNTHKLKKLGRTRPESSLMFAKLSDNGLKAAYVSENNIYVEDMITDGIRPLTTGGNSEMINGTFDWVYEEEFSCRDGFRWSPDGTRIAYWQLDARNTKDYLMVDNTDSIYPYVKPVVYPVAGESPSPYKIGVVDIVTAKTNWMNIPTDPVLQSYLPRMEWAANSTELIVQHLNRRQNTSNLMLCDAASGVAKTIYTEKDSAWIDILPLWDDRYAYGGWDWLNGGKEFLWASEKDGWRHLYRVGRDGKETLVTVGNYDVMKISAIDEKNNYVYFLASPFNATQQYLYRIKLDGRGTAERISPVNQNGTHDYALSPTASFAFHNFSNYYTPQTGELVSLPDHKSLNGHKVDELLASTDASQSNIKYFKIKTSEGVEMDAWMVKPLKFDSTKKYPVLFYVYTEPWGQTVKDVYGATDNYLYRGNLAADGYITVSIDNRGTPVPKGRAWRKIVYRKIGLINIRDQAMAAKEILKMPFIDPARTAVWGWSGGGSATLNLMFQFPDIYKTGIAIAAVGNQLTYDNIYQERYMGLPQETKADFVKGSPITYAKNLQGNLLYIHGTGDDNVHYSNAEMLVNELIKNNKQFQFMPYPNRSHSISEGPGTREHLSTLYTNYLRQHCSPGPK
ncbi:MAG: DPP IV N-terminal domain-containing protein [Chitinophagaceae bacterium]